MAKRAMSEGAKAEKAQAIMEQAAKMIMVMDYDQIKMSELAKSMNMSNGILFVYFKTKETLFMSMLWREYEKRISMMTEMVMIEELKSFDDLKRLFMKELDILIDDNPLYIRLESMRSAIFEKNTDYEVMVQIKKALYEGIKTLAGLICSKRLITPNQLIDILMAESAIITGCRLNTDLKAEVVKIIEDNSLIGFKRDFRKDVTEAVSHFLDGYGLKLSKEEGIGC